MILPERKGEQQNMKKIAAIMLALLIAGISTGAALAYLTAQESVENRLTAVSFYMLLFTATALQDVFCERKSQKKYQIFQLTFGGKSYSINLEKRT